MDLNTEAGRVVGVNGPVVRLDGLSSARRFEYVEVGQDHLPGEIITIEPDIVVAQIYEHTGGLAVGDPAWARGEPPRSSVAPDCLAASTTACCGRWPMEPTSSHLAAWTGQRPRAITSNQPRTSATSWPKATCSGRYRLLARPTSSLFLPEWPADVRTS